MPHTYSTVIFFYTLDTYEHLYALTPLPKLPNARECSACTRTLTHKKVQVHISYSKRSAVVVSQGSTTTAQINQNSNHHHCCLTPPLPSAERHEVHHDVVAEQAAAQERQHSAGLAHDASGPQDVVD